MGISSSKSQPTAGQSTPGPTPPSPSVRSWESAWEDDDKPLAEKVSFPGCWGRGRVGGGGRGGKGKRPQDGKRDLSLIGGIHGTWGGRGARHFLPSFRRVCSCRWRSVRVVSGLITSFSKFISFHQGVSRDWQKTFDRRPPLSRPAYPVLPPFLATNPLSTPIPRSTDVTR